MPEVGIVMKLYDEVSAGLKTIAGSAKAFDKDLDELEAGFRGLTEAQNGLVSKQAELRKALAESSVKVSEAQKNYKKLKDETSKGALDAAIEEQTLLQQELRNTEQALKLNSKTYDELYRSAVNAAKSIQETEKRSRSAAQGMREDAKSLESSGFAEGIMKSGLLKELGASLSGAAGTLLTSAIGEPMAELASQAISGAMSGASAGAFLGAPGMAVGALIGGTAGLVSGGTAIYQARDDSFKSYVQESVEGQLSELDSVRASGSVTAGQREQDQIAFAQRFGSDEAAREYLDQVKAMAVNTNYSYDEITGYSKSLLNTYSAEDTLGVLQQLSDASAGLNLDSSGVSMFINGLARMRTTDKATQEYLNYFSERGLDAYEALARSTGADKSQIADMVSKGNISGTDAAQAILDYIQEEFGGLSETLASTYDAMVDNLGDAEANLNAMMGEGYNEARKAGIQAQSDWLETGQMEEAYKAIGAWKAELENAKEQYIREAVDEAMSSEAYKSAEASGDAAEMGRIIMQAKIKGMGEYNANEGKDEVLAQELALIEGVRDDSALNSGYWDAGYTLGQEFSKGRAAAMQESSAAAVPSYMIEASPDYDPTRAFLGDEIMGYSHAYGLERVPHDNYPALLHEGERVLTAREARTQDQDRLGTNLGQAFSKDRVAAIQESPVTAIFISGPDYVPDYSLVNESLGPSHAFGLDRVPYDDYPALLHEGERVLTAREAREEDRSESGPNIYITVSGNTFGAGMDETAVAQALADQIALQLKAGGGR